ncbi:hypothetical protein PENTCL1PPCAC_967, partial [Pristionchus entomophagus]
VVSAPPPFNICLLLCAPSEALDDAARGVAVTENTSCDPLYSNITFADGLNIRKMLGRWIEALTSVPASGKSRTCIVHECSDLHMYKGSFQRLSVTSTYRDSASIQMQQDKEHYIKRGAEDAMLKYTSERDPQEFPFWIYKLGPEGKDSFGRPQYEYFIASNCIKFPVLVLARNPQTFKLNYK